MSSDVLNIKGKTEFNEKVLSSEVPVLVDFWAPWCMPCRMMAPVLDELAVSFAGRLRVVKVDVEDQDNQEIAMEYRIQSIPALKLFKSGEVQKEFVGFRNAATFAEEITPLL